MGWNSQKRGIGSLDTALSCKKYIKTADAREHTFTRKNWVEPHRGKQLFFSVTIANSR